MSESIAEQLAELAMFKVLINQVLRDTGQPAPDMGFNAYYQAVRAAILNKGAEAIIEKVSNCHKGNNPVKESSLNINYITEKVSLTKKEQTED